MLRNFFPKTTKPAPPSAAPVVPDDASGPIRAGYYVILFFFGGLGTWSALAPMAGAAIAPGFVKVEGNRQSLQHRYGGSVRQILVKDGDQVTRGQVLMRLDDINARARADSLTAMHDSLKAAEARLIAERDGAAEPAFDAALLGRRHEPAVAGAIASQMALFRSRKEKYEAEAADRQRDLIREELKGTLELYEKGLSPKTKVLALERAEAELMSNAGARRADMAKFEEAIGQTDIETARAEHTRLSEVADQLRDTQTKVAEIEPQLQDARDIVERTELVAPASGEVVGLKVFTEGGVISPGTTLLDIVPSKGKLVFEARVKPLDVHDVANDATADVRLTGMIGRQHPSLSGKVKTISADRLEDARSGQPYFVASIEIDPQSLVKSRVTLQPGMPADILITTKPRSVLQYILSPLSDQMALAFREN